MIIINSESILHMIVLDRLCYVLPVSLYPSGLIQELSEDSRTKNNKSWFIYYTETRTVSAALMYCIVYLT